MVKSATNVLVPTDIQVPGSLHKMLLHAGQTKLLLLNRLQTFLFESNGYADLTGIVSDKPLTVISGHECANAPSNKRYCNHIEQQIPTTITWGKKYLLRSYTGKNDNIYYLIFSSVSNTTIQHNCGGDLTTLNLAVAGSNIGIFLFILIKAATLNQTNLF